MDKVRLFGFTLDLNEPAPVEHGEREALMALTEEERELTAERNGELANGHVDVRTPGQECSRLQGPEDVMQQPQEEEIKVKKNRDQEQTEAPDLEISLSLSSRIQSMQNNIADFANEILRGLPLQEMVQGDKTTFAAVKVEKRTGHTTKSEAHEAHSKHETRNNTKISAPRETSATPGANIDDNCQPLYSSKLVHVGIKETEAGTGETTLLPKEEGTPVIGQHTQKVGNSRPQSEVKICEDELPEFSNAKSQTNHTNTGKSLVKIKLKAASYKGVKTQGNDVKAASKDSSAAKKMEAVNIKHGQQQVLKSGIQVSIRSKTFKKISTGGEQKGLFNSASGTSTRSKLHLTYNGPKNGSSPHEVKNGDSSPGLKTSSRVQTLQNEQARNGHGSRLASSTLWETRLGAQALSAEASGWRESFGKKYTGPLRAGRSHFEKAYLHRDGQKLGDRERESLTEGQQSRSRKLEEGEHVGGTGHGEHCKTGSGSERRVEKQSGRKRSYEEAVALREAGGSGRERVWDRIGTGRITHQWTTVSDQDSRHHAPLGKLITHLERDEIAHEQKERLEYEARDDRALSDRVRRPLAERLSYSDSQYNSPIFSRRPSGGSPLDDALPALHTGEGLDRNRTLFVYNAPAAMEAEPEDILRQIQHFFDLIWAKSGNGRTSGGRLITRVKLSEHKSHAFVECASELICREILTIMEEIEDPVIMGRKISVQQANFGTAKVPVVPPLDGYPSNRLPAFARRSREFLH